MPTTREIVWLAGLLEGEGSFQWRPQRRHPVVALSMTDFDVVDEAARIMEARCLGPYTHPMTTKSGASYKPYWMAVLYGRRAIAWMMVLYDLMGIRRKQQIWVAVMHWKVDHTRHRKWVSSLEGAVDRRRRAA